MISSFVLSSGWTSMRAAILSSSPGICSSWGRQSETLYVQAWSTRNILGGVKRYIKYSSILLISTFLSLSLSLSLSLLPYCNTSHSTFFKSCFPCHLHAEVYTSIQYRFLEHQYFEYYEYHNMVFEISVKIILPSIS